MEKAGVISQSLQGSEHPAFLVTVPPTTGVIEVPDPLTSYLMGSHPSLGLKTYMGVPKELEFIL